MCSFNRLPIYSLALLFTLTACGGGGGDGGGGDDGDVVGGGEDAVDPIVLGLVQALFPTNGAGWNDYVVGRDVSTAADTECNSGTDPACLHAGELRTAEVSGLSSCAGLTATDDLGAFNWICDDSTNPVRMVSLGLAEGSYLSDLLDFNAVAFRQNAITVFQNGIAYGKSPGSVWWPTPVKLHNPPTAPSGVTLVTSDPQATITLNIARAALVVQPGLTITGPGTNANVIESPGPDHLWVEGAIDATGDTIGIQFITSQYSVLRNVSVRNSAIFGIDLQLHRNGRLEDIRVSNNASDGLVLREFGSSGSDSNSFTNIVASNNANTGVLIDFRSQNNTLIGLTLNNNGTGMQLVNSQNNRIAGVSAFNNRLYGIQATFTNNRNNVIAGVTAANNNQRGLYFRTNLAVENTVFNLAAVNNDVGIELEVNPNNSLFADIAVANNNTGIFLDPADNNRFTGMLRVGNNSTSDCTVSMSINPGLVDATCAIQGSSDHVLTTGISLADSFVGKVTTDDAQNTSDSNGAADYPADPALFDWTAFDNPYRGWGIDGSAFANADHRDYWATDAGRIWDWSLSSGDSGNGGNPALLGVTVLPGGMDTLTHTWFGIPASLDDAGCDALVRGSTYDGAVMGLTYCESEFLRNAIEIPKDGIGNDNNLCESDETCLFMPNIGSYQGHGNLVDAGAFVDGALTGITLMRFDNNGR